MELEAKKTEVDTASMVLAFYEAYRKYFGAPPKEESVKLLVAHWALETGWGKSMWCYNVGNVKSRDGDGYDHCFFKCNEILPAAQADRLCAKDPDRAKVTTRRADGSCVVWFYPKHSWCRFRAFRTLEDGVYDHLKLIVNRFYEAWPYVVSGDPEGYARALKKMRYYTADESSYVRVLRAVFRRIESAKVELPEGTPLTDEERREAWMHVSVSLRGLAEEAVLDAHELKEKEPIS
jgi:hypothetical protein